MRLALALMFQDERDWLALHLPVMRGAVDGIVGVDGGSSDGSADVVRGLGGVVYERAFDWHFGAQAQYLLDCVEAKGYDALLRLDPDEVMFPHDIDAIRRELERGQYALLHLPRINFVRDRLHHSPGIDPYRQWRAWVLHKGITYNPYVAHETPRLPDGGGLLTTEVGATIYHYGFMRDPYERHWRNLAYKHLLAGDALPEWKPVPTPWYPEQLRYPDAQPLDPDEVGYRAPLEAVSMNYHLSVNLAGDRAVEYGFTALHIPAGDGDTLDFGTGGVDTVPNALRAKGWRVTCYDREPAPIANAGMILGDIVTMGVLGTYDLITCVSAIEHVGLAGRYGATDAVPDGDLIAMRKLRDALNPGGMMILTLPVGRDRVHGAMHRVYGERLAALLDGLTVVTAAFWRRDARGWQPCTWPEATSTVSIAVSERDWQGCVYAIGGFVLRKPC